MKYVHEKVDDNRCPKMQIQNEQKQMILFWDDPVSHVDIAKKDYDSAEKEDKENGKNAPKERIPYEGDDLNVSLELLLVPFC